MGNIAKYLSVYLISTVKFFGGIVLGVVEDLSILETTIFTTLGAMSSITIIALLGNTYREEVSQFFTEVKKCYYSFIIRLIEKYRIFSEEKRHRVISSYRAKMNPKRFTKIVRMAVKAWQKFGIFGIAVLTPLILTPIGGVVLAVSFRAKTRPILINMLFTNFVVALLLSYVCIEFQHLIQDWFGIQWNKKH